MASNPKFDGSIHGSGDSYLLTDIFPEQTADDFFHRLHKEIKWNEMKQKGGVVPRGVSIQGTVLQTDDDLYEPIYRHPIDEQPSLVPWSETADIIRRKIEDISGQHLNHGLIQFYKNGFDFIGEHSDKTLDVLKQSYIFNYSLGASRTMILKRKADGSRERIKLEHNSLFVLGWKTNREWFHSIKQDKRLSREKSDDEKAFEEQRISLTLRTITTYLNLRTGALHGQGAPRKTIGDSKLSIDDSDKDDVKDMLYAFAAENKMALDFDWDAFYGKGFNALNFKILNTDLSDEVLISPPSSNLKLSDDE